MAPDQIVTLTCVNTSLVDIAHTQEKVGATGGDSREIDRADPSNRFFLVPPDGGNVLEDRGSMVALISRIPRLPLI